MRLLFGTLLCAIAASAACGADAAPAGLPAFRPGLWSFSLTVNRYGEKNPQVRTMTRCADPGEEIRKKWLNLAAQACKFSPVTHTGNTYSYSSSCDSQGRQLQMKSVIVVDSDDSYRVDSQSHTLTQASREIVVARRVGDCPTRSAAAPPVKE